MKTLTVQQLATISGVSVRTLHYYDEVGLLKPSFTGENGYRHYDVLSQQRLQQILFFKELDFSLEQIKQSMENGLDNKLELMVDQRELLSLKKKRLEKIIGSLDFEIQQLKGGEDMKNTNNNNKTSDLYKAFDMREINEYHDEAKSRWGHTDAWKESQERTKHWTKEYVEKYKKEADLFMKQFVPKITFGVGSPEVQDDIDRVYENLKTFYTPSIEMFRGLGQMYVDDPRFTAYYEKYSPGLAIFMRDAITIYCDRHEKKST